MVLLTLVIAGIASIPALRAQSSQVLSSGVSTAPAFEIASIRQNKRCRSGPFNSIDLNVWKGPFGSAHGRFKRECIPLEVLIELAYNAKGFQVAGAPSWTISDRYDVNAKAEGDANFEQMRPMLQSLLADRCQLTLHRETKELPVYELVAANGGHKIMEPKEGSCVTFGPNTPRPPFDFNRPVHRCGGITRRILSGPPERRDRLDGFRISMRELIKIISDDVGRPVLDKTGFAAMFDLHLEFSPSTVAGGIDGDGYSGTPAASANLSVPSIFTALQRQLGLRLQSAKGPAEVLVIDRVERPSPN